MKKSNHNGSFISAHILAVRRPPAHGPACATRPNRQRLFCRCCGKERAVLPPPPMLFVAAGGRSMAQEIPNIASSTTVVRNRRTYRCNKATRHTRHFSTNADCACADALFSCLSLLEVVGGSQPGVAATAALSASQICVPSLLPCQQTETRLATVCRELRRFQLLAGLVQFVGGLLAFPLFMHYGYVTTLRTGPSHTLVGRSCTPWLLLLEPA